MRRIVVAGIGTNVGKTVVSSILTEALQGDYWKPVQCGLGERDAHTVQQLISNPKTMVHSEAYCFDDNVSPHYAAHLANVTIDPDHLALPKADRPLIIESSGGIMVPYTDKLLQIDQFLKWDCEWILVSKHYLGSINHTLMSIEVLKQRGVRFLGIIFNGLEYPSGEKVILDYSQVPCLGRLVPERTITKEVVRNYAKNWVKTYAID